MKKSSFSRTITKHIKIQLSCICLLLLVFQSHAQDCAAPDWNNPTNKAMLVLSATASTDGNIDVLIDGNVANNNFFYPDVSIAGLEILRVQFPQPEILTGLEYAIGNSYMFNTNATFIIQGSNDTMNWTDLTPTSDGTSPSLVISGNNYVKDRSLGNNHAGVISAEPNTERMFWSNSAFYTYYRILGVSGNTNQNPWVNELFFQTAEGFDLSNFGCNDNGTSEDFTDDQLTFDFSPIRGTGNYTLTVDGGYNITPTTGVFGQTTSFTVSAGSSGAGDLNMTLSDANVPCTSVIVIPNATNACEPGSCGEPDWNQPNEKVNITGMWDIPGTPTSATEGTLEILVDSDQDTRILCKSNDFMNEEVFVCNFPTATVLHGMEVIINATGSEPISAGVFRMEGSNDGVNYTSLTAVDFTYGSNLTAGSPQYANSGTRAYTFAFSDNTTAYSYYRLYAVNMVTVFNRSFNELYFDYDFFDPQITNQSCADNGTPDDYSDDLVTFDLNPTPDSGGGTYAVSVDGGFTITPTTGTYGQVTSFTVSTGSSGAGDLDITFFDSSVPCLQHIIIENSENACIPGPCGGPDWNMAAEKSQITGMWDVPGTPTSATEGPLAILVDSDQNTRILCKSNDFANEAVFVCNFPEATVLHGMEVIINATGTEPISSGVFKMEGSNDGVNYTALTAVDFTYGSNLSAGAPQYAGSGTRAYTFPFADNTDAYTYYRLYAVSMVTRFNRSFNELYFDYDVYNTNLENISFADNGTPGIFDDDLLSFDLNPDPGTGPYGVQYIGDFTISPATGTYGQVTSFQLSSGSAGIGDLSILLLDQTVPCVQEILIENPDLSATIESSQAVCTSPTDSPLGTITLTATDGVFSKAEYNEGTVYTGSGFASATDVTNSETGFDLVTDLVNPEFTSYYTVRAYASETLHRDFVVSLDPKVCSVADLSISVTPTTDNANEGEQLTYVVSLTNAGPDTAVNVEVKVDIPEGLELLATSPSIGDYSAGTQLWITDLVPVGTHQLSITYKMK